MGKNISKEKADYLKTLQKSLYELGDLLGQVADGNLSQCALAAKLGLTPQQLNAEEQSCFAPYLRKIGVLSDKEFSEAIKDCMSPCERLVHGIFELGTKYPNKLVALDLETEETIQNEMEVTLSDRELRIVKLRYGFGGSPQTLEQVSKIFGVSGNRIRQIECRALRKLRQPSFSLKVLPEGKRFLMALDDIWVLRERAKSYKRKYDELFAEYKSLVMREEIIDSLQLICDDARPNTEAFENTSVEEVNDLPVRWIRAFSASDVKTIRDIENLTDARLKAIADKYKLPTYSLFAAMDKCGIVRRFAAPPQSAPQACDISLQDCELSVRSFNCLARRNMETLGDVMELGTTENLLKIRNLGRKSAKEVLGVLHQHGLYMLDEVDEGGM